MQKRVTIYNIAKALNVSSATVSLALNDSPLVNKKTKQKILDYTKEIQYIPNHFARGLIKNKTQTVGLLVPNLINPIFSEIIEGIEEYLNQKNYSMILGVTNQNQEKEELYLSMLRGKMVDGIILFPTFIVSMQSILEKLRDDHFPVAVCGMDPIVKNISYVKSNMEQGVYLAIKYLIEKGHKNIAFIAPFFNFEHIEDRYKGYLKACKEFNIEVSDKNLIQCDQDFDLIYKNVKEYLTGNKNVTAIFCLYDYMAFPVIQAIYSLGLSIPGDIALVGHDNIRISALMAKPLTTVDAKSKEMGLKVAELLLEQIENPLNYKAKQIIIEPELIIREST